MSLDRIDPFHSMQYEHPGFTTLDVSDDAERQERAPTMDILEWRAEVTLPRRNETLIAEFAGEVEEERGRRFTKWRFVNGVNKYVTTKLFQGIEKAVRNSFAIKLLLDLC